MRTRFRIGVPVGHGTTALLALGAMFALASCGGADARTDDAAALATTTTAARSGASTTEAAPYRPPAPLPSDAATRAETTDICRRGFTRGAVAFAAELGIELSPTQAQRASSVETERELVVPIQHRVADPYGQRFDPTIEGCQAGYDAWVSAGRPLASPK